MVRTSRWLFCIAGTLATGCALPGITADYDQGIGGGANGGSNATGGSKLTAGATNAGATSVGGKAATGGSANGGATSVGGAPQTGGVTNGGGASAAGGTVANATGGASAAAGGNAQTGGATSAAGGIAPTGGMPSSTTGGSRPNGGASSTGGAPGATGGRPNGGASSTGGTPAATGGRPNGGATSTGGTPAATGGAPAATGGSVAATGGANPTGGATPTGGANATGGLAATGGAPSTGGATSVATPIPVQMFAGDTTICAVVSDGTTSTLWCWGDNSAGQLADGTTSSYSSVPVKVTLTASSGVVTQVSVGYNHSCATFSDGAAQCWGYNGDGQLGNGIVASAVSLPVTVMANATTPLTNIRAIAAGKFFTCALVADTSNVQTVKCWGWSGYGQLGTGIVDTSYDNPVPATVIMNTSTKPPLTNVRSISVGYQHSCAVLNDNTVYCWGENSSGQLGNGVTVDSGLPVAVTTSAGTLLASSVATLSDATCALLGDGTVQCWGTNYEGELGNGRTADSLTPVAAKLTTKATSLSGYYENACVVLANGGGQCWGDNSYGQLAHNPDTYPACNGDYSCSNVPINMTFPNSPQLSQMVAGSGSIFALGSDGSIYGVGYNVNGELGNGNTTDTYVPVNVYVAW